MVCNHRAAKENFAITGTNLHPELVKSLARIKKAAAVVNAQSGNLTAVKKGMRLSKPATKLWRDIFMKPSSWMPSKAVPVLQPI